MLSVASNSYNQHATTQHDILQILTDNGLSCEQILTIVGTASEEHCHRALEETGITLTPKEQEIFDIFVVEHFMVNKIRQILQE